MVNRTRGALLATTVATLLSLSACSSSGTSTGSGESESSGGTSNSSEIRIGVIGTFSGVQGTSFGGIPKSLQAWEDTVNDAGGINGQQVEVMVADATTQGAGLTAAQQFVEQDGVVAILDFDPADQIWVDYVTGQKVPVVGLPSIAVNDPGVFPVQPSPLALGYGDVQLAKQLGGRLGIVYCAESPQCSQAAELFESFAEPLGVTVPVSTKVSSSAPDYTAVCNALKDARVSTYVLAVPTATSIKLTETCYQAGLTVPQTLQGAAATPEWLTNEAYNGSLILDSVAPFFVGATPGAEEYRAALSKYAEDVPNSSLDNSYAANAWVSGKLLQAAIDASESEAVTRTSILEGLHALQDVTLGGMVAPLTYPEDQMALLNCYFLYGIEDGEYSVTHGTEPQCAPADVLEGIMANMGGG